MKKSTTLNFLDYKQQLPHRQMEMWRHTDLTPLWEKSWITSDETTLTKKISSLPEWSSHEWRLVFIDGFYSSSLSTTELPSSLKMTTSSSEPIQDVILSHQFFVNLHQEHSHQAYLIELADNSKLNKPLQICFITTYDEKNHQISGSSITLKVGKYSQMSFIEEHINIGTPITCSIENSILQIELHEGAKLTHIKQQINNDQHYNFAYQKIRLQKESDYHSFLLMQGGTLSRNALDLSLDQEGAKATLHGLYTLKDNQQNDLYLQVDHKVAHTFSEQYYKGILDNSSHGVFRGGVKIFPDAQQISSTQLNRNLLLSNKAHIDTQPQLEINADDVKCSHGATIGQLNSEEIFYLQSRGISLAKAISLLSFGFAFDLISRLPEELQHYVLIPFKERFASLQHTGGR